MGKFLCSHFNTEGGRKYATFLAYYALLFQEGKNATEMQKKKPIKLVQCMEKVL